MKGYGNMTAAEKEINKDDLHAYQKYDNNQYSMIPGVTSSKRMAQPRPQKHASPGPSSGKAVALNEVKLRKHEDRLVQYGILRGGVGATRHGQVNMRASMELETDPLKHIPEGRGTP